MANNERRNRIIEWLKALLAKFIAKKVGSGIGRSGVGDRMKGVAYIAGPYSARTIAGVVRNIREAERIAVQWWHHGYAVICPHMNTALLDGEIDYEQFMEGDLEFVRRADVIVMLPNWRLSAGAQREHALAQELRKKIVYE